MVAIPQAQVFSFFVGDPDPELDRWHPNAPESVVTVKRVVPYSGDAWFVEKIHPSWSSSVPLYLTRGALTGGGCWMSRHAVIKRANILFTLEEALIAANEAVTRVIKYSR